MRKSYNGYHFIDNFFGDFYKLLKTPEKSVSH
jgi:hypothetical protein